MNNLHTVRVSKSDLLDKIIENRAKHEALYKETLDGYNRKLDETLSQLLADHRAGKRINTYITLVRPDSHLDDYDAVIGMLDMSVENAVEISREDYTRYVLDQWEWKDLLNTMNAAYKSDK